MPILLTDIMLKGMGILELQRIRAGISILNPYFFATIGSNNTYVRGTDALRFYSSKCGASRPEALRSTKLRKHIATMTQLLNLKENELDIIRGSWVMMSPYTVTTTGCQNTP